jgi:hypothetical protein
MRMMNLAAVAIVGLLAGSAVSVTAYASKSSTHGGTGGRATANGGDAGSTTGGNGVACGILSGNESNDINNALGGQNQVGNGVGVLDNLFVPVLSAGSRAHQNTRSGGSTISHNRGAVDNGSTGNSKCGNSGDGGNGGNGGKATGGRGGSGGNARSGG